MDILAAIDNGGIKTIVDMFMDTVEALLFGLNR